MGKYDKWRSVFAGLEGNHHRLSLAELEGYMDGMLPPSARKYQAWWSGDRYYAVWRDYGWSASPNLVREEVLFTKGVESMSVAMWDDRQGPAASDSDTGLRDRFVLVGCVKSKVGHPALAKDLYDSPLWRKRRRY